MATFLPNFHAYSISFQIIQFMQQIFIFYLSVKGWVLCWELGAKGAKDFSTNQNTKGHG